MILTEAQLEAAGDAAMRLADDILALARRHSDPAVIMTALTAVTARSIAILNWPEAKLLERISVWAAEERAAIAKAEAGN